MILAAAKAASGSNGAGQAIILALLVLYFVPTFVAMIRKVPNLGSIVVINLFLGWTLIGWVVALAMAVRDRPRPAVFPHAAAARAEAAGPDAGQP